MGENGTGAQGFSIWKNELDRFSNLGDDFYAPILNTDAWKPIINSNSDLILNNCDTGASNEIWRFQRKEDGSYIISSCVDGKCLDVQGAYSAAYTPVGIGERNECNAQKWYIIPYGDGYIFKPKCSDCVLDLINNDTTQGNKLQIYTRNNSGAQKWSIYHGEECQLKSPTVSASPGTDITKTKFSWNSIFGRTQYSIKIWKDTTYWDGAPYFVINTVNTTNEVQLPEGYYEAYVDVGHYYQYKMSNIVTFYVHKKPTFSSNKTSVAKGEPIEFSYGNITSAEAIKILFERDGNVVSTETADSSGTFIKKFIAAIPCKVYVGALYDGTWVYSDKIEIDVYDAEKKPTFSADKLSANVKENITFTYNNATKANEVKIFFEKNGEVYFSADTTASRNYATYFENTGDYKVYVGARYDDKWIYSDKVDISIKEVESKKYPAGDANNDGKVNNKDATLMLQYFADWENVTLNEDYLDVNGDGKKNNKDATYLLQYLADWDVILH